MQYPVNEIFQTIQGEGYYIGKPSIFIRLQKCIVACKWCDTKYTWNKSYINQTSNTEIINKKKPNIKWSYMKTKNIISLIKKNKWTSNHIVITGGEPCLYNLFNLTTQLEKEKYFCQIETSGTEFIICSKNTWVTLSPKKNVKTLKTSILRANEIKFPILTKKDYLYLKNMLLNEKCENKNIFLQPINQNEKALKICIKKCIKKNWRLSIQMHKYINIR